jgi:hypothetical protein
MSSDVGRSVSTRTRSRWLCKSLIVSVAFGYALLTYYYCYKHYMSEEYFASATVAAALSIPALLLLLRPPRHEGEMPKTSLGKVAYALPVVVFLCAFLEIWSYRHLGLFSVIAFVAALAVLAFSDSSSSASIAMALSLVAIIVVLYGVYSPSFGADTWRDATQAAQIIERGGLRSLTIFHEAYPLPVVSILYAIYSVVSGLSTPWSSSVVGLAYALLLALWTHVLARRIGAEPSHVAPLLAFTTPFLVLWSVWFIPQAYSLLMALPLLFLDLNPIIIVVLVVALALGHGAVALWTVVVLVVLFIAKRAFRAQSQVLRSVEVKLAVALALIISFVVCTTLSPVLQGALSSILEVPRALLKGARIVTTTAPVQVPVTASLGIVPVVVLAVLGLVLLVEVEDVAVRLLALISLAGLGMGYVGAVVFPALDLPRYLGVQSAAVLAVLSPRALRALIKRGRAGSLYATLLLSLAITSFCFAGTLMPEDPYTANPYSYWSIYGLVTYGEARELKDVAPLLCCNNYLVDWRAGAYIAYECLWVQPFDRGFYDPKTNSSFTFAGSYRLVVTPEYLKQFNGILILRESASKSMFKALAPQTVDYVKREVAKGAATVYYSGNRVLIVSC